MRRHVTKWADEYCELCVCVCVENVIMTRLLGHLLNRTKNPNVPPLRVFRSSS